MTDSNSTGKDEGQDRRLNALSETWACNTVHFKTLLSLLFSGDLFAEGTYSIISSKLVEPSLSFSEIDVVIKNYISVIRLI